MSIIPPLVFVFDNMDLRRAGLVRFLVDWASQERVALLSVRFEQARQELGDRASECRMVVLNVGAASCAASGALSEIKIIRALAPSAFIAVVADEENPKDVIAAMHAGVAAYISNRSDPEMVLRALSFVLQGGVYFPRCVIELAMKIFSESPRSPESDSAEADVEASLAFADFSERQRSILAGVCRGEPNKIIGRRLGLPESTVKVHVREIMRKLGVSNRTQVAIVASDRAKAIGDLRQSSKEPSRHLLIPFDRVVKGVDRLNKNMKLHENSSVMAPDREADQSFRACDAS